MTETAPAPARDSALARLAGHVTPRRILVAGWLVFLLYAYPGYITREGADQLFDSRVGAISDSHWPMFSELWWIVEHVISGPAGMLFLQSLLLLWGTYSLARRALDDRRGAWVAVGVLLMPPVIASHAVICAEAQLAAWLIAGFALLRSDCFWRRLGGLALLVVAASMRSGGPIAALPIIATTFEWRVPLPRWQRIGVAIGAWVAVLAVATLLNYALVDVRTQREQVRAATIDIVGVLDHAPALDDARVRKLLGDVELASAEDIQARAKALYGKDWAYAGGANPLFVMPETQAQRDALFAARHALVQEFPGAYLSHRWYWFELTLGLRRPGTWKPVYTEFVPTENDKAVLLHAGHHSLLQRALIASVKALQNTWLFRPALYLALAIVLFGIALWRKRPLESALLASAIVYELVLMFVETTVEYRDSHTMVVLTLLAAFVMLARLRIPPKAADLPSG